MIEGKHLSLRYAVIGQVGGGWGESSGIQKKESGVQMKPSGVQQL